jgi:hypothetical protein
MLMVPTTRTILFNVGCEHNTTKRNTCNINSSQSNGDVSRAQQVTNWQVTRRIGHTSHVTRHTSHVTRHTSHEAHVTRHTSHNTRHTSHVTRHTSHVTRHTSHVTRHTSHITRHTSHVTRHTSHVTRHTSHRVPWLPPRAAAACCGRAAAYGDFADDPDTSSRMSLLDCLPNNGLAAF